jgi:hypothetical protein
VCSSLRWTHHLWISLLGTWSLDTLSAFLVCLLTHCNLQGIIHKPKINSKIVDV